MLKVMVVIGSDSDKPKIQKCLDELEKFEAEYKVFIASAHRAPLYVEDLSIYAQDRGYGVIIAAAGMAAALPGSLAAHTILPVVGIPLNASPLAGVDALYAMAQLPPGVPVATVAIDGARNGAILALQILALTNVDLAHRLEKSKRQMVDEVVAKNNN